MLCNDASLRAPGPDNDDWLAVGDPTEAALLSAGGKLRIDVDALHQASPRQGEAPFDSDRKRMSTAHRGPDGRTQIICKGAPESLLHAAILTDHPDVLRQAADRADALAHEGLRVLAVAQADRDTVPDDAAGYEHGLHLLGLVAILDPPRASAAATIAACRDAGITPVLITGDHPATATAIATELHIIDAGEAAVDCRTTDPGPAATRGARVFARATPQQKVAIIDALRDAGEIVAMTGDGVNDGPALHRADIGVAMGKRGTEVARQAADLVLADDELATVVAAAEEGRRVYANIRRFLLYALSGGTAEITVMLAGPFVGLPLPLLPAQILWINLLTHGLPGLAMGSEPADPAAMRKPPTPVGRNHPRRRHVATRPARRGGHRRRHDRRRRVGACHRPALANFDVPRSGPGPARRGPGITRPPRHGGQPHAVRRRRRRPAAAGCRRLHRAAASAPRHRTGHRRRPADRDCRLDPGLRRHPPGPPHPPDPARTGQGR
nr:hypothetical protein GCM10020092_080280 [Actinoplanes digitatis]